jgi:uncharacterized protein
LEEKKGQMTVGEAGRRGGLKTSETHGEEFYSEIGRKGGESRGARGVGAKASLGKKRV